MNKNFRGFTLAEVLITLVIIGVIAAITVPALIAKYHEQQLKTQFKTFYSTFNNAMRQVNINHGPYNCYYWVKSPYSGKCNAICSERDEAGACLRYVCSQTGEDIPDDYNGPRDECPAFRHDVFNKGFKIIKYCKDHAYANGCLPKDIKGTNKVKQEADPNYTEAPNYSSLFNENHLYNECPVYIVANGMYFFSYYSTNQTTGKIEDAPVMGVDINGFKGPNKWGHDIFTFQIFGNPTVGPNKIQSIVYATEKGGKSFAQMQKDSLK